MGGDQHDHALSGQVPEHVAHRVRGARIQLCSRLVHEQHVRSGAYCTGQHEPLRLAARQFAEPPVGRILQVEQPHGLQRLRLRFAPAQPLGQQREHDMVQSRSPGHAVRVLKHPAYTFHVLAFHRAMVRLLPSGKNRQQRRLAASRWPASRHGLAGYRCEIQMFEQHVRSGEPMRQIM